MSKREYIEREAALRDWPLCDEPADAYQYIRSFPAADVRPVMRGKWIKINGLVACSECKENPPRTYHNYCPKCGAMMEEI